MAIAPHPGSAKTEPTVPLISQDELLRRNRAAIALLDRWDHDLDDQEQQETMRVIREALGENRTGSSRALFP